MARPIVVWPDPVLQSPTKPVTEFGPKLDALLADMMASLVEAKGIGIAANQIGVSLRVAWVGRQEGEEVSFFEIVNPQFLEKSGDIEYEEGCLSVPDEWHVCPRFKRVRVRYQDRTGAWHEVESEDKVAHVLQHEIDHLDGLVYVNHLSPLKRDLIKRRMQKLKRDEAEAQADDEGAPAKGAKKGRPKR